MGIGIYEVCVLLLVPTLGLWVSAFVDVLRGEFPGNNKLISFLAILFVLLLGSLTYLLVGRKQKIKRV